MKTSYKQFSFPFENQPDNQPTCLPSETITNNNNNVSLQDRAFHEWYRFVLSFPPHLVRDYIRDFQLDERSTLLDPFCGSGTTVLESKLHHIHAVGLEANLFPHFASTVKTTWDVNPDELLNMTKAISEATYQKLETEGIDDRGLNAKPDIKLQTLNGDAMQAMIKDSISPLPLHKTLVLLNELEQIRNSLFYKYCILALGKALVNSIGNLRFGPEVGVGVIKKDTPVVATWRHEVRRMVDDLHLVYGKRYPEAKVHLADARELSHVIQPNCIDAVITSPPYPNEKDYTRTTRLESVILGFISDVAHLRTIKKTLLRSNTRGVYTAADDDRWVAEMAPIQRLAEQIESRRIELGKTSGFEKLYARVTKLYFGGMARHLHELTYVLKPGAKLAYVVGDQASYLQVMIRTGQILAEIAERQGYQVERIDLFRTRFATATQRELCEEVVVLKWPGIQSKPH
ncbi:MAG: DNA methyltransferase [Caldilineaceae bacterium]